MMHLQSDTRTSESDPWKRLALDVVIQAFKDMVGPELPKAVDAAIWLVNPGSEYFLELMDIDLDPKNAITRKGFYKKLARRLARRKLL